MRAYRDMVIIREFETMLNTIKTKGAYQGIPYDHMGPAHLSIGQESAVVGQCMPLGIEDFTFGSHRSHGEIIAKCLAAAAKLPDAQLTSIMEGYFGGATLRVVEKGTRGQREGSGHRLPALRGAGRDLRPRERLQQGHGRLDARLLRTLRQHAQQRHRGRLGGHRGGRGAVQEDQPASRAS